MEIKIPKEIRTYHESVFWGLTLRQLICSGIAVVGAVSAYLILRNRINQELLSWICIAIAGPFGVAGFFRYHGLTLEKFLLVWFRSEFLCAGTRKFKADNQYLLLLEDLQKPERIRFKPQNFGVWVQNLFKKNIPTPTKNCPPAEPEGKSVYRKG